ncbi:MAG: hypothetical protein ACYDDN_11395 [Candidatus Desulforudaceae bacterium]
MDVLHLVDPRSMVIVRHLAGLRADSRSTVGVLRPVEHPGDPRSMVADRHPADDRPVGRF